MNKEINQKKQEKLIKTYETDAKAYKAEIEELRQLKRQFGSKDFWESQLTEKDKEIHEKSLKIERLQRALQGKNLHIKKLEHDIVKFESQISELQKPKKKRKPRSKTETEATDIWVFRAKELSTKYYSALRTLKLELRHIKEQYDEFKVSTYSQMKEIIEVNLSYLMN